jgi:hypothetical protein
MKISNLTDSFSRLRRQHEPVNDIGTGGGSSERA